MTGAGGARTAGGTLTEGTGSSLRIAVRAEVASLNGGVTGGRVRTMSSAGDPARSEKRRSRADGVVREVKRIIDDVALRGDEALLELARRLDGVELAKLEVPRSTQVGALRELSPPLRAALERAARNIWSFNSATKPRAVEVEVEPGVRLSQQWGPLDSVGVYAPGGRAAYASSVLMGVVPAKVAGVAQVVVCSPPGPSGLPSKEVMAASALAGANRLFALGGAGAIAAMACGTASVPRVAAIVGPGNAWVTEAKRQVQGDVRIDSLAGPSEVLVIADADADPRLAALELAAQAEHDPEAASLLVTTSRKLAAAVERELSAVVAEAPRREIIAASLAERGGILTAADMAEALDFASSYAPEHLVVIAEEAEAALETGTSTAGSIFLGPHSSVAFGDYLSGANHVLPTGGRAKAESGLSTHDFMRSWTVQTLSRPGAAGMAADTALLAEAEGLPAHAEAARARSERATTPARGPVAERP